MIRYNPKDWWGLIFRFHKSDTFSQLFWVIISLAAFCTILAYIVYDQQYFSIGGTTILHSLLGFVISLLLVFRTNTAYDRWWEGRKLWGALVNNTRNFALKMNTWLPKEDMESRERISDLLANYALTLREHLRGNKVPLVAPKDVHQPNYIAQQLFNEVDALYQKKIITGDHLIVINNEISSFTDICGACERIKKTPIPYSYSMFIKKFIFAYVVSMPFALVADKGYWIVLMVTFVFYALASLEVIAEEIEDPFGLDSNDLPLNDITRTIYHSTKEIMGIRSKESLE